MKCLLLAITMLALVGCRDMCSPTEPREVPCGQTTVLPDGTVMLTLCPPPPTTYTPTPTPAAQ